MASSFFCLFRASIHLPSHTDMSLPSFWMKSEVSGPDRRPQIILIYGVRIIVSSKQLKEKPTIKLNHLHVCHICGKVSKLFYHDHITRLHNC